MAGKAHQHHGVPSCLCLEHAAHLTASGLAPLTCSLGAGVNEEGRRIVDCLSPFIDVEVAIASFLKEADTSLIGVSKTNGEPGVFFLNLFLLFLQVLFQEKGEKKSG